MNKILTIKLMGLISILSINLLSLEGMANRRLSGKNCIDSDCDAGPFNLMAACAPEQTESNITSVERAMTTLGQNELKNSFLFHSALETIKKEKKVEKKVTYLADLLGVKNEEELTLLAGTRDNKFDPNTVATFANKLSISNDDAKKIMSTIVSALNGQRR